MVWDAVCSAHAIFIITRDFQFLERDPWYQIVAFGELSDVENTSEEGKIFQDTTIPAYILRIKGTCKNVTFIL